MSIYSSVPCEDDDEDEYDCDEEEEDEDERADDDDDASGVAAGRVHGAGTPRSRSLRPESMQALRVAPASLSRTRSSENTKAY